MKRPSILNFVVAVVLGIVALVAMAQTSNERAPYWPKLLPNPPRTPLKETYSDVPWHQKTGTYVMNEIDVPLVFPYEALPSEMISKVPGKEGWCTLHHLTEEDCMLEVGVANILVYHRTDSLYDPTDSHFKNTDCAIPQKCMEVRLDVSRQRATGQGDNALLVPEVFGTQFVITDASTYGPQMPWEFAHFCDSRWPGDKDLQDPVCYADYFSPFNDGFNNAIPDANVAQPLAPNPLITYKVKDWPKSAPWSAWPTADSANNPNSPGNPHCESGRNQCTFVLAGFGMQRVPAKVDDASLSVPKSLVYAKYNNFLLEWVNDALAAFPQELGTPEINNHFPWQSRTITWNDFVAPRAVTNPFLGTYAPVTTGYARPAGCDATKTGPIPAGTTCNNTDIYQPNGFAYPLSCSADDLNKAAAGTPDSQAAIDKLRGCALNFEIHPNGWLTQWPTEFQSTVAGAPFNYAGNQYGRTVFVYAGVPGMQMPVSFLKPDGQPQALSIYEQVHNASVFSLFLPIPNLADQARAQNGRNYLNKTFYHTLLMSNHMESDPEPFADGIRGKVLWHNEYRMQPMFDANEYNKLNLPWLNYRWFQAAFKPTENRYDPSKPPAPFHNNTCDGCHVRNGSGVPIDRNRKLVLASQTSNMWDQPYNAYGASGIDYTFTGVVRPMKLVFFDLQQGATRPKTSKYSQPLNASAIALTAIPRTAGPDSVYYNNAIMNFYGDSFHVSPAEMGAPDFDYQWTYKAADPSRLVVDAPRLLNDASGTKTLAPQQINLKGFTTPQDSAKCQFNAPVNNKPWPKQCQDINNAAIMAAVAPDADGRTAVGYMHLNGKRLGNLGAIEAIPDREVVNWQAAQAAKLGKAAGEVIWSPGTRDGSSDPTKQIWKKCAVPGSADCVVGRFGWLGDRGTLEDQVANAAFVEMNMTSSEGYDRWYKGQKVATPLRYEYPNCGPADRACTESKGNSDLTERDIERMADYGRWLGIPMRSELQVSLPEVAAGEGLFIKLQCDTCHVIKRIDITQADIDNSPLSQPFRKRLTGHVTGTHTPFLSYLGTDLLMHDMGYLSQVGDAKQSVRDADGFVLPGKETYVQKIRTPALKGLRFNNYVTDAYWNTNKHGIDGQRTGDPGCDFLLHDGRACNAIEAALLHDGPAVKKLTIPDPLTGKMLNMIEALSKLTPTETAQLRAFLYSL